MVEQQENQQEHSTFSLGLNVYATVRNDLLHVLTPPLKSILSKTSFTSPLFPLSLFSFLKKRQIDMTAASRPLATLLTKKARLDQKSPIRHPIFF